MGRHSITVMSWLRNQALRGQKMQHRSNHNHNSSLFLLAYENMRLDVPLTYVRALRALIGHDGLDQTHLGLPPHPWPQGLHLSSVFSFQFLLELCYRCVWYLDFWLALAAIPEPSLLCCCGTGPYLVRLLLCWLVSCLTSYAGTIPHCALCYR